MLHAAGCHQSNRNATKINAHRAGLPEQHHATSNQPIMPDFWCDSM